MPFYLRLHCVGDTFFPCLYWNPPKITDPGLIPFCIPQIYNTTVTSREELEEWAALGTEETGAGMEEPLLVLVIHCVEIFPRRGYGIKTEKEEEKKKSYKMLKI